MITMFQTFFIIGLLIKEGINRNKVYISNNFKGQDAVKDTYIILNGSPFVFEFDEDIKNENISLDKIHRYFLNYELNERLDSVNFVPKVSYFNVLNLEISLKPLGNKKYISVNSDDLLKEFFKLFEGFPFSINQNFYFKINELAFNSTVSKIVIDNPTNSSNTQNETSTLKSGILTNETIVCFNTGSDYLIIKKSISSSKISSPLLKPDFSFEDLGIGGLKKEISIMFRRAFVQRLYGSDVIKELGIPHVKGIILHGPPGTGKTLIARQIGSLLDTHPPKVINGPEILNKYVGQSEENIRNLFIEAEKEYKQKGSESGLHLIIFDEIDAICKKRGKSASSEIGDQIVNQLLSKIDGVESLDNILIIGMTNRLDLIDSALLRPGRFEIHIEIGLPSEEGRSEIFRIHTKEMRKNGRLGNDINLDILAMKTRNYTGAEIHAVVKSAASFAFHRKVHLLKENEPNPKTTVEKENSFTEKSNKKNSNKKLFVDEKDINVTLDDFLEALNEVKPSFGCDEDMLQKYIESFIFIKSHVSIIEKIQKYAERLRIPNSKEDNIEIKIKELNNKYELNNSQNLIGRISNKKTKIGNIKLLSLLLHGKTGSGKTTLAIKSALETSFPFIKIISPIYVVGMGENARVDYIKNVFEDAYKSEESIVILDDILALIDYVAIGPRFLNSVLQAIKIYIKNVNYKGNNRILVIGTASNIDVLHTMDIVDCFTAIEEIPLITNEEYQDSIVGNASKFYKGEKMTIKNILTLMENDEM